MKDNGSRYSLDTQDLREVIEYSSRFYENWFYVVIDAESFEDFEDFECFQLAYDILLITNFCQVKMIIIVGCFSSREKTHKKKRMDFLRRILAVVKKLENYFDQIKIIGIDAKDYSSRFGYSSITPEEAMATIEENSITIFPAVKSENGKPVDIIDVDQVVSELNRADKRKLFSKVIVVSSHNGIYDSARNLLSQITPDQACSMVEEKMVTGQLADISRIAVDSIEELGIKRVHIVSGKKSGALLVELYTKEGSGTMIYKGNYDEIRSAKESDASGIYSLIIHYAKKGLILQQSFDDVRLNFADFIVATIDGHVVACARLRCFIEESNAFVSSVAVSPHYIRQGLGKKFLVEMEKRATDAGVKTLTLVGLDWWLYQGFQEGKLSDLPEAIRKEYAQKNPKNVLIKKLS